MRRLFAAVVLSVSLAATAGSLPGAQEPPHGFVSAPVEGTSAPAEGTSGTAGTDRWVEVTPLRWGATGRLRPLEDGQEEIRADGEEPGPAMVCTGGGGSAVHCAPEELAQGAILPVPAATGLAVTGRLLEGREPVAGARIGVLPAALSVRRPFTLPLELDAGGHNLSRSVPTDERGRFRLPRLAAGEYLLEVTLPGGRIERTAPFRVRDPSRPAAALSKGPHPGKRPAETVLDLGDLHLDPGLTVEFWAWTPDGTPLADALVGALQGEGSSVLLFEGRTDHQGRASLRGFRPDQFVHASCSAPGYLRHQERFPRPPLRVDCGMVPVAAIEGSVENESGPLPEATVSLFGPGDQAVDRALAGENGAFRFAALAPGEYRLVAAASGYRWEARTVGLATGEQRQLGPLILTPAPEVEGVVQDALDGTPIPDATVLALEPAGALGVTTDDEGLFSAPLPEEGALVVMVSAPGYARTEATLPAGAELGDEPWIVELDPGGRIRVVVWSEDESPCAGCTVVVERPGSSSALREGLQTSPQGIAETGALAPGRYHVVLEEVRSLGSVVTVRSGDDLREALVTNGRTTEVFFLPSSTVEVRFWPPPPAGWRLSARGSGERSVLDPVSPGIFTVPRHRGEELELSLIRYGITVGLGRVPGDLRDATFDVALPATQVHGRLQADGESGAVEVEIRPMLPGAAAAARAITNAEGGFRIPFLPPGAYGLLAGGSWLTSFQLGEGGTLDLGELELAAPASPGGVQ